MSFWNSLTAAERHRWNSLSPDVQKRKQAAWKLRTARYNLRRAEEEAIRATDEWNACSRSEGKFPYPSSRLSMLAKRSM